MEKKTNNKLENLRPATKSLNALNVLSASARNSTGLLGAHRKRNGYESSITVNGDKFRLGVFADPVMANAAYMQEKIRLVPDVFGVSFAPPVIPCDCRPAERLGALIDDPDDVGSSAHD